VAEGPARTGSTTGVGRRPVLSDGRHPVLVGMLTRSDLVGAHRPRLRAERVAARELARG
jgi:CBS domain-containing protein